MSFDLWSIWWRHFAWYWAAREWVCVWREWMENWIAKTHKNKAHLRRAIFFFTTIMSIYRPYMQIGDYFFLLSRRMYCCRHRLIFISLFMPRFLYYSAFWYDFTVPLEQKTLNHEYQNMTQKRTTYKKWVDVRRQTKTTTGKRKKHFFIQKTKISVHYINFQVIIHFKWTRLICTHRIICMNASIDKALLSGRCARIGAH